MTSQQDGCGSAPISSLFPVNKIARLAKIGCWYPKYGHEVPLHIIIMQVFINARTYSNFFLWSPSKRPLDTGVLFLPFFPFVSYRAFTCTEHACHQLYPTLVLSNRTQPYKCPQAQIIFGFTYLKLEYLLNSEEHTKIYFVLGRENVCAIMGGWVCMTFRYLAWNRTFKMVSQIF